jgi:anti-anti-sigma regulatory factor
MRLPVSATPNALGALFAEIRLRAACGPVTRFSIDCSGLTVVPGGVLAELGALRDELRQKGMELALVNCSPDLQAALPREVFTDRSAQQTVQHQAHALRGPHASFLRTFRAGA